jgi:HD-like signal output (HDOD) protein
MTRDAVKVPPFPAVAMRIHSLARQDDFDAQELKNAVASDQALSAAVLRCANSALYSRGLPIASLDQALRRIGAREMATIALASIPGDLGTTKGSLVAMRRQVWQEALISALVCRELAKKRKLAADDAFMCGFLHDFGKLVCMRCIEELLAAHPETAGRSASEWIELVDRYHVELGLVVATRWQLPAILSDAITLHHGTFEGLDHRAAPRADRHRRRHHRPPGPSQPCDAAAPQHDRGAEG